MINRISLLILSLVLLAFPISAKADPWPIKEFDVIAVAAADEWPDWTLERVSRDVQRLVQETGIIDPYFPTLFQTIPVEPEVQAVIETYLHDVANQFEQWGLRAPSLQPQVENASGNPAYRVFLVSNLGNNAGEYHSYCFDTVNRILLLSRDSILNQDGTIKSRGYATIAHELFHAVQYSYPFVECPTRSESVGNWIVEGQARAVGWDTAIKLRPLSSDINANERWGARDYNERLQVPLRVDQGSNVNPYGTSSFWRHLAERQAGLATGSKPGPESSPVDYGYLPLFLNREAVERNCDTLGGACDAEIDWLNTSVLTAFRKDLRTVFTEFADGLVLYGDHRNGLHNVYEWSDEVFPKDGCDGAPFGGTWSRTLHRGVIDRFEENSIQCFAVTFKEFENDVLVEFKVTAPAGGTDIGNLNFAVAGRPINAQKARVKINTDTQELSVAWVAQLPVDETSYITLTNMADRPSQTGKMTNLPYTITVLKEFASMGSGGGPSASDIDTPLPFELDTIKQSYLLPGPLQEHVDIGMNEVCMLQLVFQDSRTRDGLMLRMDIEGPVRPGTYPIYDGRIGDNKENPGQFYAQFGIGKGNALGQGFSMVYKSVGGNVRIDDVSTNYLRGTATIIGHNGKPKGTDCESPDGEDAYFNPRGNQIACPGPQDMVIQAKFAVIPKMTPGLGRYRSMDQCVVEKPYPHPGTESPDPSDNPPSGDSPSEPPTGEPPIDPQLPPDDEGLADTPGTSADSSDDGNPGDAGVQSDSGDQPPAEGEALSGKIEEAKQGKRWAIIRASGAFEDTVIMREPELSGGCSPTNPVSIGLLEGLPNDPDFAYISMNTEGIVGKAETGSFPMSEFKWDYGTLPVPNMPEHLNIRAPNRFTGKGTMELTSHDPNMETRHMAGTLRVPGMENREGQVVDVEVEFRVDWSCGLDY